ncbi:hypothetical protein SELMODRAFT_409667 [Selaginella moellendorffii]|uniref:Protein kinase domain-containing protein n=1 Tax=Selaginella moellendorffii TaxID=88036 RepID=D8RC21_SELML|nr:hypothetical protein SELMODRAFT_409667 [Selaginella moellendorffii]
MARVDCWSCHSHSAKISWGDDSGMLDHRMLFAVDDCPLLSPGAASNLGGKNRGSGDGGGRWKRLQRSVCSYLHSGGGSVGGAIKIRREEKKAAWNAIVESLMQRHPGSQLPERLISMIRRHFESLPLSYAQAGLGSDQIFLHIRLVEQARMSPHSGSIAIAIIQERRSATAANAAARSSNASDESLFMASSPPSIASPAPWEEDQESDFTVTFATMGVPITKHSIAWAFKRAAIPVTHTSVYCRKALFLGMASVHCAREYMRLDRMQEIFKAAAKKSRLRRLALGLYGSSSSSSASQQILVHNPSKSIPSTAAAVAADMDLESRISFVSHRLSIDAVAGARIRIDVSGDVASGKEELSQWALDPSKMSGLEKEEAIPTARARFGGEAVALELINPPGDGDRELQEEVLWLCTRSGFAHANVLPIRGIWIDGRNLWAVSKLVSGGSLRDLVDRREKIELRSVLRMACDIAEGMQFLHECGIVHRQVNLKLSNILLDDNGCAVIGGLRIARAIKSPTKDERSFKDGEEEDKTSWPVPPEVDLEKSAITPKADVYSFGTLLCELVSCHTTADQNIGKEKETPRRSRTTRSMPAPVVPLDCFPLLKYLIHQCWASNPLDRPDFCEILEMVATATRDLTR